MGVNKPIEFTLLLWIFDIIRGGNEMIYSNERKVCLSEWLKANSEKEYNTPLKMQKFHLYNLI